MKKGLEKTLKIFNYLFLFISYAYLLVRSIQISFGEKRSYSILILLALICYLVFALFLHTIIHEGGHLITGLMTGYEFVSFRVGACTLIKGKDGKLHFKKMTVLGTGGQCLMSPPKVPYEKCPHVLYHLGGGLINILLGLTGVLVYHLIAPHNAITFAVLEGFGVLGLSLGISNLIPCKLGGVQNDGYNICDYRKNEDAKRCIFAVLRFNALLTIADSYQAMPDDVKREVKDMDFTGMDITNGTILSALNNQSVLYFAEGNYEKSYALQKLILDTQGTLEIFKNEARCECLFYELTHDKNQQVIESYYTKELKQYIKATSLYPSRQRLMYAYYHFYKKDEKAAEAMYEEVKKSVDTYMIKADALSELSCVEMMRQDKFEGAKFEGA